MEGHRVSAKLHGAKRRKEGKTMTTTHSTTWEGLYRIGVLREELRHVEDRLVRYRFCTFRFATPEYYVEILFGEERAAAHLGSDYPSAQILFDKLVCGVVTPCTLSDIIEDIKNMQNPFTSIKGYDII
jgi:hypothetical protein